MAGKKRSKNAKKKSPYAAARLRIDLAAEDAAEKATAGMRIGDPKREKLWLDTYDATQTKLKMRRLKAALRLRRLKTASKRKGKRRLAAILKSPEFILSGKPLTANERLTEHDEHGW